MNKFWFLTKYGLKKKIDTKWFKVVNILLLVVIVAIINLNTIITFFGGDFARATEIILIDHTGELSTAFEETLASTEKLLDLTADFTVVHSSNTLAYEEKDIGRNIIIELTPNEETALDIKVVSERTISALNYQTISQVLVSIRYNYALSLSDINAEELAFVTQAPSIERIVLSDSNSVDDNMSTFMSTVFPTLILPFFMLIIILVQMIGADINEEKSTRSIEIIISNLSPKQHFLSKILASNIFVILQAILFFIYGAIGLLIHARVSESGTTDTIFASLHQMWDSLQSSGMVSTIMSVIPFTIILMILSFIAYSLLAGILASMTSSMEDFQQIQVPITILLLIGYYLSIMASLFDGALFIRVVSYIPFISCLLSPTLFLLGQITIIDMLISIALLILVIYIGFKYGLRVYKVGILNYSNEKIWKRVGKIIKTKDM